MSEYSKSLASRFGQFTILSFLDRLLFETLNSNYAGIRYGQSFLASDSIVAQANLISILVELRSGYLAGLRWYYDTSPKVTRQVGDDVERFQWTRASLGWAFDVPVPEFVKPLITGFNVQPKIGLLDLDAKFILMDEAEGVYRSLNFSAKNSFDFSLEIDTEYESYWSRNRLWAAFSIAAYGHNNRDGLKTASQRLGVDAYFDILNWKQINVNLLAFGMIENLNLSKNKDSLLSQSEEAISDLNFSLFFLGGGVTVSW